MLNASFISESYYDSIHEREEAKSHPKDCGTCSGTGKELVSACCGMPVEDGKCELCEKETPGAFDVCETCNGEGEIYE